MAYMWNGQKNKQVQKYPVYGMINKRSYTGYLFPRAAGQSQACLTLAAAAGEKQEEKICTGYNLRQ